MTVLSLEAILILMMSTSSSLTMPSIALPEFGHEIAIKHSLSHLSILLSLCQFILSIGGSKRSYSSLIKELLLLLRL
jgi:hypothetical protein